MIKLNFESPDVEIYRPDNIEEGEPGITTRDIFDLCKGDQELCRIVADLCDWQYPSTVLEELEQEEEIEEVIAKWIVTDPSCNQMMKYDSPYTYTFKEDRIINPDTGETVNYRSTLDIRDYTQDEITSALSTFGWGLTEEGCLRMSGGVPFCNKFTVEQLILEALFELEENFYDDY